MGKYSIEGGVNLRRELDMSSEQGGMDFEGLEARLKLCSEQYLEKLQSDDFLGTAHIKQREWKEGKKLVSVTKNGDKRVMMENMTQEQMRMAITYLNDWCGSLSKGGENTGAASVMIAQAKERGEKWLTHIIDHVDMKLQDNRLKYGKLIGKKFAGGGGGDDDDDEDNEGFIPSASAKKKKKKSSKKKKGDKKKAAETPRNDSDDEDDDVSVLTVKSVDDDEGGVIQKRREFHQLLEEVVYLKTVLEVYGLEAFLHEEVYEKVNTFKSMECLRVMAEESDKKVLRALVGMTASSEFSRTIQESIDEPKLNSKDTFEGKYGLPCGAATVLNQLIMNQVAPTLETVVLAMQKIEEYHVNFTNFGKNGGFTGMLVEFNNLVDTAKRVMVMVKEGDLEGITEGFEVVKHEYWIMLGKLSKNAMEMKNETTKHSNYKLVENELNNTMLKHMKLKGDPESRWIVLQQDLRAIDANNSIRYVSGGNGGGGGGGGEAPFTLNTNIRNGNKKFERVRFCSSTSRKGFCENPRCKYVGMEPDYFKNRPECDKGMKDPASCEFGRNCKYRHLGDPKEMTSQMLQKCLHHKKKSVNFAGDGEQAEEKVKSE